MLQDTSDQLSGVIALAVEEARRLGQGYLGSEHLLFGLARQEGASTASILSRHDVSPERLRARVRHTVGSDARRPRREMLPLAPAANASSSLRTTLPHTSAPAESNRLIYYLRSSSTANAWPEESSRNAMRTSMRSGLS
jgi:ATP-dependent Clp protease ATP-binding subunit ClpA